MPIIRPISRHEKQQALLDLYQRLVEAETESIEGTQIIAHKDLMTKLRKRLNA